MFVIRAENPCNTCVTLCANLERIGQRGQILFALTVVLQVQKFLHCISILITRERENERERVRERERQTDRQRERERTRESKTDR